jgi:hypothetical protein
MAVVALKVVGVGVGFLREPVGVVACKDVDVETLGRVFAAGVVVFALRHAVEIFLGP